VTAGDVHQQIAEDAVDQPRRTRRPGVLEQLQSDIVGRQARGHDARPDHSDDQQRSAYGFGHEAAGEREVKCSSTGLGEVGELGHDGRDRFSSTQSW